MPCSLTQHLPPYPLPRAPTLPPPSLSRLTFAPSFLPPSLDPRALRLSAASVTMSNLSSPGSLFLPPSALSTPTSYPTFFVAKRPKRRRRRRGGGQGQVGSWGGGSWRGASGGAGGALLYHCPRLARSADCSPWRALVGPAPMIGLDAVAGGSPYGRHHDRSSGWMLLTGKLAGAVQLGIGRHRRRAVPRAQLTAGRGPARRSGGRRGTTGTSGREVHLPGAGPRPRMALCLVSLSLSGR